MTRISQWTQSPRIASLVIVLLVFGTALTARRQGYLQFLEFRAYDQFIRWQPKAASSDPIVLVEYTENDIQNPKLDYPLWDNKLAELFTRLEADQPALVGLDIWRDIPVPKSGLYLPQLNEVFLAHSNIVAIYTLGGIAPPPALKSQLDRLGFNDNLLPDVQMEKTTPKVRRTLLLSDDHYGLAFRLAVSYLEQRGIFPESDPADPDTFHLGKARLRKLASNDGAYVGVDAAGWQMLLNFKCPNEFTRFTISDALEGRIPAGALRGKIVLIGMNAPSVSDERVTPIRFDHRGMEVQASATHQLLRMALDGEQSLKFWSDWLEDAWLLCWCIAGGAIGYWVRSPWRFSATILVVLGALGLIVWGAFVGGWWIPLVAPAAACLPAAALVTSYISYQEQKQRSQLMHLFSKQVSPAIAQAIWEQRDEFLTGDRPRSQELIATVLFTDLKGFSSTSEVLKPAQLMDWLNEYMEAMAQPVMANNGVIEKYIGDSIMAVFGVPIPRASREQIAEDARNAVRCAMTMDKELERLNADWKQRGLPPCSMRIGIHTGPLIPGSLGSADRQEYTVIGDTVNTASRLESFDKDSEHVKIEGRFCRTLISEATQELLCHQFVTKPVGAMSLKGKSEPVTIYHVLGETTDEKRNQT